MRGELVCLGMSFEKPKLDRAGDGMGPAADLENLEDRGHLVVHRSPQGGLNFGAETSPGLPRLRLEHAPTVLSIW